MEILYKGATKTESRNSTDLNLWLLSTKMFTLRETNLFQIYMDSLIIFLFYEMSLQESYMFRYFWNNLKVKIQTAAAGIFATVS